VPGGPGERQGLTLRTFALSFHAKYRCASSGACCTSGWDIAVEPDVEARVRAAPGLPPGLRSEQGRTLLAYDAAGRCAFFETGRTCSIHRRLGHEALPVSCRLFPRVCLLAPRGVSISLSHYCPTAASLLFDDPGAPAIVADAFPAAAHYEGLDAREGPPPLLRPGVWLGWDGHDRWERHVVTTLGRDLEPAQALDRLAVQAEAARAWAIDRGAFGPFLDRVLEATPGAASAAPPDEALVAIVDAAVPARHRQPRGWAPVVSLAPFADPVRRYLAARAFGAWVAIQGQGLRTTVLALRAALAVLGREAALVCAEAGRRPDRALLTEAFRRSDLLLVHLASPEAFAQALGRFEADRV
jgi:hypothetical protein